MDSSRNFDEALAIAKQALQYIGRFKTAPTPAVYEVWYRFAEGNNEAIQEQLSHAIDQADSVSIQLIDELYQQFCFADDDEHNRKISSRLETEVHGLQSAIASQMVAGEALGESIDHANKNLSTPDISTRQVGICVEGLLASNRRMQSQLEDMKAQLQESHDRITFLKQDLVDSQKVTMTDPLTGVGNRRCFEALMDRALQDRDAEEAGVAVLVLVDLDEFKTVNDTLGHSVGDSLLKFIATTIQALRSDAAVTRFGGDEFGIFVREKTPGDGLLFAEEIKDSLATSRLRHTHSQASIGKVTASISVAILRKDDTRASWFDRADRLLFRAKEAGRNCVRAERQIRE